MSNFTAFLVSVLVHTMTVFLIKIYLRIEKKFCNLTLKSLRSVKVYSPLKVMIGYRNCLFRGAESGAGKQSQVTSLERLKKGKLKKKNRSSKSSIDQRFDIFNLSLLYRTCTLIDCIINIYFIVNLPLVTFACIWGLAALSRRLFDSIVPRSTGSIFSEFYFYFDWWIAWNHSKLDNELGFPCVIEGLPYVLRFSQLFVALWLTDHFPTWFIEASSLTRRLQPEQLKYHE